MLHQTRKSCSWSWVATNSMNWTGSIFECFCQNHKLVSTIASSVLSNSPLLRLLHQLSSLKWILAWSWFDWTFSTLKGCQQSLSVCLFVCSLVVSSTGSVVAFRALIVELHYGVFWSVAARTKTEKFYGWESWIKGRKQRDKTITGTPAYQDKFWRF